METAVFRALNRGLLVCALSGGFLSGCQHRPLYKETRVMMGTFVEVVSADKRACGIAFEEMKRIENLLSKYLPGSEVSRLNKAGRLKVSFETFFIISKSVEFWKLTGGAFDITAAPLADLWGFTGKNYAVPGEGEITRALSLVGSDKIILNTGDSVVEFRLPGMKVDLGAIAKGYALDCAVRRLKAAGVISCLINAGGQVYCLGDKYGEPWEVAVRDPRGPNASSSMQLTDRSVATSGDYEQFFFQGKKRYAHIFDPTTGYPAESGIASVTVIAPDGVTADALATSIFVLGKEKAAALEKKFPGTEVRIYEQSK